MVDLLCWEHKKSCIGKIHSKNTRNLTKYTPFLFSGTSFLQIAKLPGKEQQKALETEVSRAYFTSVNYRNLDYSMISLTTPEPTVRPPSRYNLTVSRYILCTFTYFLKQICSIILNHIYCL